MPTPVLPNGPDTKEGYKFVYINIPLVVLSLAIFGFHVCWRCRKKGRGALNRADACVVVALVLNIIQVVCMSMAIVKWGFGHHTAYMTPKQLHMSLLYFFVFQCMATNTVGIAKLSVLFLYLDIFPQPRFRIVCWCLIVHICLGLMALSLATIFQCRPIRLAWDKETPGSCINLRVFLYSQCGWNTLMDIAVLVLPIPVVAKLRMTRRSKLGLLAVFVLGAFVCVTGILRMITLNLNDTFARDLTWATGTAVLWTQLESTMTVICACASSIRAPLARLIFGTTMCENSYDLSDGPHQDRGQRSGHWGDRSNNFQQQRALDSEATVLDPELKGSESAERIMGIKKTVSIDLTFADRPREINPDGSMSYQKHHYRRHDVGADCIS